VLPISSILYESDAQNCQKIDEYMIESISKTNIHLFTSKEHPARIQIKLNNSQDMYMILKGIYRHSDKLLMLELRFTAMLNSFIRHLPKTNLMSCPTFKNLLYSIVIARDNYLIEHLNGNLIPMKDLSNKYYDLMNLNEGEET
jgi:hypothetical protein